MAKVLIVDDDSALREGLAETIADLGHEPHMASNGPGALTVLAASHVDCVLLDLRMPGGMDGIEVLRRIRALNDAPPVVVLTAFATAENTIEANVYICGARTKKGTPCSRRVHGPVRCWQHKGMPAMLPPEKLLVKD